MGECFPDLGDEERLLSFSRIYFYAIHGVAATYRQSAESCEAIMARLGTTFDEMIEVLLLGIRQKIAGPHRHGSVGEGII